MRVQTWPAVGPPRNSVSRVPSGRDTRPAMIEKTSSSLIRRVKNPNDHASWGEFVELYEPLLVRYIRKRGLSEHDAQDVVQTVFISLLRKLPTFELDRSRGRFRTWLWQVTHNAVVDWARTKKRVDTAEDKARAEWKEGSEEPDREWDEELQKRILEFALEKVKGQTTPNTWACFEQYLLKGRSGIEVGAELGMPANTVYVYAARVMARVREQCEAYLEDLGHE